MTQHSESFYTIVIPASEAPYDTVGLFLTKEGHWVEGFIYDGTAEDFGYIAFMPTPPLPDWVKIEEPPEADVFDISSTPKENQIIQPYDGDTQKFGYYLGKIEAESAAKWVTEHESECSIQYAGAAGGKTSYTFTMTGIGVAVEVSCACGAKKNVTDYSSW